MKHFYGSIGQIQYDIALKFPPVSYLMEPEDWNQRQSAILSSIPGIDESIKPLVHLIVAAMDPARIFMIRHGGSGYASEGYIDLLIVIPDTCQVPFVELEPILQMTYLKDQRVSCSLHRQGTVAAALRKGHGFYSLYCIPDNLIYDDGNTSLPALSVEAMEALKAEVRAKFDAFFQKALYFREAAIFLHQRHSATPLTAFLLHQSIEFAFRAVLISLNGYDKRTHEIRVLKRYVRPCTPALDAVFPDNTEEGRRLVALLDESYSASRYDDHFEITASDLAILFEKGALVHEKASLAVASTLESLTI